MKIIGNYILHSSEDEYILLPDRNIRRGYRGLCSLNKTGAYIWQNIEERKSPDELIELCTKKFGIDRGTARSDVMAFLSSLESVGIIEL